MLATDIADGHVLLADWLFLIAAVLFVIAAVLTRRPAPSPTAAEVGYVALALVAVAWLVL